MKLELDEHQIKLLGITCEEEVKYYQRCNITPLTLDKDGQLQRVNGEKYSMPTHIKSALAAATSKNIKAYNTIADKLRQHDTDFDDQQIKEIKMMLNESEQQFSKHIVVKKQIDGTVSFKHVHALMNIALSSGKKMLINELHEISKKIDQLK